MMKKYETRNYSQEQTFRVQFLAARGPVGRTARGGKGYAKRLKAARTKSIKMLNNYICCAEQVLQGGGHVCFEWPRGCSGWSIPELVKFIKKDDLFVAEPDGCAFGLKDDEGNPHYKSWRIVTSSYQLARNLDAHKCSHPPDFNIRTWQVPNPLSLLSILMKWHNALVTPCTPR